MDLILIKEKPVITSASSLGLSRISTAILMSQTFGLLCHWTYIAQFDDAGHWKKKLVRPRLVLKKKEKSLCYNGGNTGAIQQLLD